jgi:hypothetical protein
MVAQSRRTAVRQGLRLKVQWDMGEVVPNGFTKDISASGMGLRTHHVLPPGTELFFIVRIEGKPHPVRGVVRWAHETPPGLARYVPSEMGISFSRQSAAVDRFFREFNKEAP